MILLRLHPLFHCALETLNLTRGQELLESQTKVLLQEVKIGTENSNKRVDALAKFSYIDSSISFFAYSTNQSIMTEGLKHEEFFEMFLAPLLLRVIDTRQTQLDQFINMMIYELSKKPKNKGPR